MANNESEQHIDDNVQEAELVQTKKGIGFQTVSIVLIVLLLLLMAGGGWWLYQQIKLQQQQQTEHVAHLESELETLRTDRAQGLAQLDTLKTQQQALADKLEAFISRETLTSEDLMKTWALQEIKYLLTVANERAQLAHDVGGAIRALQLADKQLQSLSDYRLHPLRALIAEEIMDLEALTDVDVAGIALKLQTAARHVQTLRVKKGPEVRLSEAPMAPESTTVEADWRQALDDIWQQIRSLVVIRHDQTGDAAVLVPEQRYFLYQNLSLQLESARLALLNGDDSNYQHSLQTAVDWLQQYFTGEQRDAMLNTLKQLQEAEIKVSVPDISGSLNWLEEYQQ